MKVQFLVFLLLLQGLKQPTFRHTSPNTCALQVEKNFALPVRKRLWRGGAQPHKHFPQDNLNTYLVSTFYETFAVGEACALAQRFGVFQASKSASWLNMMEINFPANCKVVLERQGRPQSRIGAWSVSSCQRTRGKNHQDSLAIFAGSSEEETHQTLMSKFSLKM